jgi:PAS domain S-box-containing protein
VDVNLLVEKLRDYEHVIETMNCGLLAEDLDGTIVFANQKLLEWLGYERDEVIGQPVFMLVPFELRELLEEDLKAAAADDLRARLLAVRRKDSTTFPAVTIPQRFLDAKGELDGYFSVVVDLGAVLTARQVGRAGAVDIRSTLHRIALELESISWSASVGSPLVPLHLPELQDLSPREMEVLSHLMAGDRVPAIARRLHISQHTVRNHLKSMYRKLGVGAQSELIERVRSFADGSGSSADPDAEARELGR